MTDDVLDIPFADAFAFDPSPTWAKLRDESPVVRVRTLAGAEVWLVTRYDDVKLVLADPRFSRAGVVAAGAPRVGVSRPLPGTLPTTDPPEHTRLRKLVSGAFSHRTISQTRPWVRELCERLADDVVDGADLRQVYALPLPIQVICTLLGVPYADRERFREWTELAYSLEMADQPRVEAAMASLLAYMGDLVAAKRREPRSEDLLDELCATPLTHDELTAFALNLLVAGHETSANQITSFVATLLREPAQWDRLVADPELVPSAVEELMRFTRLSEVGQLRVALEDVRVAGVTVRAGEGVMASIGSANRDPRAFAEPDSLDLARTPNQHLALGIGPHFCLGAQLARIELQEALLVLLRRFPGLRAARPVEELAWRRVLVSGLAELPVSLG
ncbi:cytochrome P450 [Saccharothrix sp. 6-C]|uniref:Nocardicin N-oxygenase n=1 Tax=Saccharothrix texasensis TaxID=103734 RepID=A0A3N1HDS3_9PSEU|nr:MULTISPECIES: cytochrome P450 [Saccharothrix]QQQ75221.1 cytochrome P450 [Saccharothrix sp. 6-C]ROP40669.1 nocardicin N-oxygenase [Saccharothrix texasensis]